MKLIIDIDKEIYESSKRECEETNDLIIDTFTFAIGNGTPIPDNATVCDIEQIRDEIEKEADYQDAYVNADIAKGMYLSLEIIGKYRGDKE